MLVKGAKGHECICQPNSNQFLQLDHITIVFDSLETFTRGVINFLRFKNYRNTLIYSSSHSFYRHQHSLLLCWYLSDIKAVQIISHVHWGKTNQPNKEGNEWHVSIWYSGDLCYEGRYHRFFFSYVSEYRCIKRHRILWWCSRISDHWCMRESLLRKVRVEVYVT